MNEDSQRNDEKQTETGAGRIEGFRSEDRELAEQRAVVSDTPPEPPAEQKEKAFPGFLELVYGILFEPDRTMGKVAEKPPLGAALVVVTALSLLGTVMWLLTASRLLGQSLYTAELEQFLPALQALMLLGAITGLLWGYVKWFGYSAILHLASELLGGRGRARGVFAAAGLAGLPSIFMIPVQFFAYWFGAGNTLVTVLVGLFGLAVGIWSVVLMVFGLRQVHGLSTGRSLLIIVSPFLVLSAFFIFLLAGLLIAAASIPAGMDFPRYF